MKIPTSKIKLAEQVLIDNGIEADEAQTVLQAIGFVLLDQDLYASKYKANNIKWNKTDTDASYIADDLPNDVIVSFEDLQLPDNATDNEVENALAVYLVDNYGFQHSGFTFEKIDSQLPRNIFPIKLTKARKFDIIPPVNTTNHPTKGENK